MAWLAQPRYRTRSVAKSKQSSWQQLCAPELLESIASFLPLTLTLRSLDKLTAQALSQPKHKTIKGSEPLPSWAYGRLNRLPVQQLWRGSVQQRQQVVCLAARSTGSVAAVDAALKAMDLEFGPWLFTAVAGIPDHRTALALLRQLADSPSGKRLLPMPCEVMAAAAAAGNTEACKWLLLPPQRHNYSWDQEPACAAARAGHAGLAEWLTDNSISRTINVGRLLAAAAHGCSPAEVDALYRKYLWWRVGRPHANPHAANADGAFGPNESFIQEAGGLKCLSFAMEFERALSAAAGSTTGQEGDWALKLDCLLSLHCGEHGAAMLGRCGDTLSGVFGAAMSAPDGLSRVRQLWQQRGWRPADGLQAAVAAAAARGDNAAVDCLFEEMGARVQPRTAFEVLRAAAGAGQLETLQLLICERGLRCSETDIVVKTVALAGHMHVARWLLDAAIPDLLGPAAGAPAAAPAQHIEAGAGLGAASGVGSGAAWAARARAQAGWQLVYGGCERGCPQVVALGLAAVGGASQARASGGSHYLSDLAVWSGSPEVLRLLAEAGQLEKNVYDAAARDRPMLRMLVRLRICGCRVHQPFLALLEDPDVPLGELRWLLEGDGGGGAAVQGAASGGGAAAGVQAGGRSASAPLGMAGPAADMLLADEGGW